MEFSVKQNEPVYEQTRTESAGEEIEKTTTESLQSSEIIWREVICFGLCILLILVVLLLYPQRFQNVAPDRDSNQSKEIIDKGSDDDSETSEKLSAFWRPLTGPTQTFRFVHIPKAGGTSLEVDVEHFLGQPKEYNEFCFYHQWQTGGYHVSMFREPRTHVYSQYLECKYDRWGKDVTRPYPRFPRHGNDVEDMAKWVDYFLEEDRGNKLLGCYDPWNMQTRIMTCRGSYLNERNPQATGKVASHTNLGIPEPRVDIAIRNVQNLDFFGVTEYYSESMCVLFYLMKSTIKPGCLCTDQTKPNWTHESHHVPKHSINDLSNDTLHKIDIMTERDKELYHFVLEQFYLNMKILREEGKEFICKEKLEKIKMRLQDEEIR